MYAGVTSGQLQPGTSSTRTPRDQMIPAPAEAGSAAPRALSTTTTTSPRAERTGPVLMGDRLLARGTTLIRGAWKQLRRLRLEQGAWIAIIALAAVLRFWGLGDKPLHHDESLNAYYSLLFARLPASYAYDPLFHGPFQFHAEGVILGVLLVLAHLFHVSSATGAAGTPWITDATVRLLPATTGVVLVALTYGLRRELGRVGALAAAFLLAISPAFVYFSRFLREDIYFACFTYATVVCAVQFSRTRALRWFIALVVSFILACATKEAIYLNVAVFGSFLVGLAVWELGHSVCQRLPARFSVRWRLFFGHAAPLLLLGAFGLAFALLGLHQLNQLSHYVNAHTAQTAIQVERLETLTVVALLSTSGAVAVIVIAVLLRRIARHVAGDGAAASGVAPEASPGRPAATFPATADGAQTRTSATACPVFWQRGITPLRTQLRHHLASLRGCLDAERQPFLRLLLDIPWRYWFIALGVGWLLFVALYWVVPGGTYAQTWVQGFGGVGRGIWQGLYYWLEQQQIARGAQPWYYYLLLIPLYEQAAVILGLAGIVVSLLRPTHFRLFLVSWLLGTLALYSWAGEKMPWLALHILLPLELLAGIALAGLLQGAWALVGQALVVADRRVVKSRWAEQVTPLTVPRVAGVALGLLAALALLVPTLHGTLVLTHQDAADGPHEMLVYVQTTPDVLLVMGKIARADRVLYGGTHALRIGVGPGQEWPFRWYLREYPNTTFNYDFTAVNEPPVDVLILSTSADGVTASTGESFLMRHPQGYAMQEYALRSWWDEAYKPAPCVPTKNTPCPPEPVGSYGVGIGPYLSYGSTPPANATFQVRLAAGRLWEWLWLRTPLGKVSSVYYDFDFIVRDGGPIRP
jgi:predicted membrane-bound mannosyltransferase